MQKSEDRGRKTEDRKITDSAEKDSPPRKGCCAGTEELGPEKTLGRYPGLGFLSGSALEWTAPPPTWLLEHGAGAVSAATKEQARNRDSFGEKGWGVSAEGEAGRLRGASHWERSEAFAEQTPRGKPPSGWVCLFGGAGQVRRNEANRLLTPRERRQARDWEPIFCCCIQQSKRPSAAGPTPRAAGGRWRSNAATPFLRGVRRKGGLGAAPVRKEWDLRSWGSVSRGEPAGAEPCELASARRPWQNEFCWAKGLKQRPTLHNWTIMRCWPVRCIQRLRDPWAWPPS